MHELITGCAELALKTDEIRRNLSEISLEESATLIADWISMMLADHHPPLGIKGITTMNAISRMAYTNDNTDSARSATHASQLTMGLGPNQLTWLRRNMDAFKDLEDQRYQLRQDALRAARIAGLI
jgi:hypothetical protein